MSAVNTTRTEDLSRFDRHQSVVFIAGVLIWYAFGFSFILINDILVQPTDDQHEVYRAMSMFDEHYRRNDTFMKVNDEQRRQQLWTIYYGKSCDTLIMIDNDQRTIDVHDSTIACMFNE
jgi:hypothetical protein